MNTSRSEITLRAANSDDALCLSVLATQVFLDTYAFKGITQAVANEVRRAFNTETFVKILNADSIFITLAVREDALVGFAQTTVGTNQALAPTGLQAELDRLYVQEPYTHLGIGSRLLIDQETLAAERGAEVLWLSPWVGNDRALRFYAKHQYQDYGLVYFYMDEHEIENRVYAKRLPRIAA
jgi:ribosomal protein S18 acetylase RimI-like enzyme